MKSRALVAAVLVLLLMGACTEEDGTRSELRPRAPRASPTGETTSVIGFVGTMSGRDSWRGTDAFEGAHFGVQALNRNVDPDRPQFELVTLDDRGDGARAAALVAELAANPRTVGVIYAGPTRGLPPAQTALADAGIPALLCYGDLYSARLLRSHLFQLSPPYLWQARAIASYVKRDRRYTKIGALLTRKLDGRTARFSLQSALVEAGAHKAVARFNPRGESGIRLELDRLRAKHVQAVVVQGAPQRFDAIVGVLDQMKHGYRTTATARKGGRGKSPWRPQVIGLDEAIHSTRVTLPAGTVAADSYARGAHYLPVPSLQRFRSGFVDWWGEKPLGWEVRAYQAVQMIGWASLRTDQGGD
ncbi:MAG TPA: ABC transporter substrate-binding protein, partial [Actinomycetota bacterium]